jgi:hypothetical protein
MKGKLSLHPLTVSAQQLISLNTTKSSADGKETEKSKEIEYDLVQMKYFIDRNEGANDMLENLNKPISIICNLFVKVAIFIQMQ